jgi:tetratricopeptide (TPR) repeat protein
MATRKKPDATTSAEKGPPGGNRFGAAYSGMTEAQAQMKMLEQGLLLFREQRLAEAKGWFEKAVQGPELNVRLTAKTHLSVCERRLRKPVLELATADDHYNYGVERLNARDLDTARKHLEISLALRPNCEHVLYAFAGALALSGDLPGSYENLRRAIELNPANRNSARQDPDFHAIAHHSLFSQLLHPERHQPF